MAALFETAKILGPDKFHTTRRKPVTCIGLHTAENLPDINNEDQGAENVAEYLRTTDRQASYHTIVDSDSTVHLLPYWWTAFHIVGLNSLSVGLSFATRANMWATQPEQWVNRIIDLGAIEAVRISQWAEHTYGRFIPAQQITRDQALNGVPGFIRHSTADPARRKDPGPDFPIDLFFERYTHWTLQPSLPPVTARSATITQPAPKLTQLPGATPIMTADTNIREWQKTLGVKVDGDAGPITMAAMRTWMASNPPSTNAAALLDAQTAKDAQLGQAFAELVKMIG